MKVLVTGGTGFTGKALCARLISEGHEVTALDYKEGIKTQELRDMGANVIIGSVTDREAVQKAIQGVEFVHHLAAAFRELDVPESHYEDVNVGGTRVLLEESVKQNVKKFVYCSTCGVHGNVDNPPANEEAPIQPADYYQKTKYDAEPLVNEYQEKGLLQTTILRPAAIYGPGDPERFLMIFRRVNKGFFPIFGSGKTFYHPLYVENLVDAFMLCMDGDKGNGGTYLIADEEYLSIEKLINMTATALNKEVKTPHFPIIPLIIAGHFFEKLYAPFGKTPPIFPRRVDWFRQNRAFDISAAKKDLGYQPRVGLEEGLRLTGEWYLKEGYIS